MMDERELYEALGLLSSEQEEGAGAEGAELAGLPGKSTAGLALAEEELSDSGAEEAELAGLPQTSAAEAGAPEEDAGVTARPNRQSRKDREGAAPEKGGEDARYAAARRRAEKERDAAIGEARREMQRAVDEAYASLHITDPATGKQITTKAEYDAYRSNQHDREIEEGLSGTGLKREAINQLISSHPAVQAAMEAAEKLTREERRRMNAEAERRVEEQISEISEMDPRIKSFSDLSRIENYSRFSELVQRGNSLSDAYKLACYDKLIAEAGRNAAGAAGRDSASKLHLQRSVQRGNAPAHVPDSIAEQYRMLNPGMSDAEIQRDYNRYLKAAR